MIRELKKSGIRVTTDCEDPEIACVLVAYDNELTYEKLTDTCKILSTREVGYVATNPDLVCPIEFGFVPDCGAMCQMIEHAVKKKPYFIGKPEPGMVDMSVAQNHFTKDETLVIGDRLYTDILSGTMQVLRQCWYLQERQQEKMPKKAATSRIIFFRQYANFMKRGSDHGDRDGGSKRVSTGSICVPCKKSLKVQEKSFQAFFVSLLECSRVVRNKSSQA